MLTLVSELPDRWRGYVVGLWKCACGTEKKIPIFRVTSGGAKSCGCLRITHGQSGKNKTAEYVAWAAMHSRCSAAEDHPDFQTYVSRGITICDRWTDFSAFFEDLGPKPTPQHSLGRIDNDLGYFPENCHWETAKEQMINTGMSMRWHIRGQIFDSCRDAGRALGVDQSTIRYWVKNKKEGCYAVKKY